MYLTSAGNLQEQLGHFPVFHRSVERSSLRDSSRISLPQRFNGEGYYELQQGCDILAQATLKWREIPTLATYG